MSQAFQKDRQLFAILIFHYYHFQLLNRGGGESLHLKAYIDSI